MNAKKKKAMEIMAARRKAPAAMRPAAPMGGDNDLPEAPSAPPVATRYADVIAKRKGMKK